MTRLRGAATNGEGASAGGGLARTAATLYVAVMESLRIDIWSDIACPWCYVGKRRLEAALEASPVGNAYRVHWHAFELDPSAPRQVGGGTQAERLARKYGTSVAQAQARMDHLAQLAKAEGLSFDFDRLRPGNTFDAHRVLRLAAAKGLEDAVEERFFRGYLCEGEAIGEQSVLVRLAAEAGLDADEVQATLASDAYAAEVRADERDAARLGVTGVPFFVIAGRYAVAGAQPSALLAQALERAHAELAPERFPGLDGVACGPEGCEVPAGAQGSGDA